MTLDLMAYSSMTTVKAWESLAVRRLRERTEYQPGGVEEGVSGGGQSRHLLLQDVFGQWPVPTAVRKIRWLIETVGAL